MSSAITMIIVFVVVLATVIISALIYTEAVTLMESGREAEAVGVFFTPRDCMDSRELAKKSHGISCYHYFGRVESHRGIAFGR